MAQPQPGPNPALREKGGVAQLQTWPCKGKEVQSAPTVHSGLGICRFGSRGILMAITPHQKYPDPWGVLQDGCGGSIVCIWAVGQKLRTSALKA